MSRNDSLKKRALVLSCILVMSLVVFFSSNIPRAVAYPYLFEDDFETGDLSKWTGEVEFDGVVNATSTAYLGSYGLNATITADGLSGALVYRQVDPGQNVLYVRAWVNFSDLLATNSSVARILLINNGFEGNNLATAELFRESGVVKWALQYRTGGTSSRISNSTLTVQTDTWYAVELKADLSSANGTADGSYAMWVNGDLVLEVVNVDTQWTFGDYVYVGRGRDYNLPTEVGTQFLDNVAIDTSYIGAVPVSWAPIIDSFYPLSDPTVAEGQSQQFNVTAHDPDGDPLWYAWLLDNFMFADTQNWTYTPDYNAAGVHNVTLLISDSYGLHATQQWSVTVLEVNTNQAPIISYYSPATTTPDVDEGSNLAFEHVSSDPEGGLLWYAWLLDSFMHADTQNWTYTPDYYSAGVHNVTLLVSDAYGAHATQQWSVTVLDVNTNQAPAIDYYAPTDLSPEVEEGGSLVFEHVSSDPEGGLLWYAWLLDNFMYADTQNWTYTPDYFAAGVHNVTLLISDSYGAHATQQWSVTVLEVNRAPTIDYYAPADTTPEVNEGDSLVFEHVSSDPDGGFLWYAWLLDNFMYADTQNWTYTPDYYSAGVHNVTLLISDSYGFKATQQWTVTVVNVNRAPTIDSYTPLNLEPQVDEGASLDFTHTSSDLDGNPLYYAWLLDGYMYADTQNWAYTPDYNSAGIHNVTLLISDSYGAIDTQQWTVTVLNVEGP